MEAVPAGPQVALEGETFSTLQSTTFPEAAEQFKYMQPVARVEYHKMKGLSVTIEIVLLTYIVLLIVLSKLLFTCSYGSATGTIWLDNVNCFGTESRLTSCQRNSYGSHNCVHSHDVAIDCSSSGTSIPRASGKRSTLVVYIKLIPTYKSHMYGNNILAVFKSQYKDED